jgi:3-phenylpropionate/trans-cinnamate dioxygenase ferredoxin component
MAEVSVTALDQLGDRELAAFDVSGNRIAIARVGDALYGFGDTCTHRGCSLANGDLEATIVTCPCHGSQFDVTTGDVVRGPASEPVPSYSVRLEGREVRVEV